MKKQTCSDILSGLGACHEAVAWVRESKCRSLETAWKKCERGDWMLWYAGKLSGPVGDEKRKLLVLACCACARLSLPLFEKRYPDDKRVRDCIETAEKWARGEATVEALQVARRNCYAAAAYAAAAAAADAYRLRRRHRRLRRTPPRRRHAAAAAAYAAAADRRPQENPQGMRRHRARILPGVAGMRIDDLIDLHDPGGHAIDRMLHAREAPKCAAFFVDTSPRPHARPGSEEERNHK